MFNKIFSRNIILGYTITTKRYVNIESRILELGHLLPPCPPGTVNN